MIDTEYSLNNVDVGLHSDDKNKNIEWNIEKKVSKRKTIESKINIFIYIGVDYGHQIKRTN